MAVSFIQQASATDSGGTTTGVTISSAASGHTLVVVTSASIGAIFHPAYRTIVSIACTNVSFQKVGSVAFQSTDPPTVSAPNSMEVWVGIVGASASGTSVNITWNADISGYAIVAVKVAEFSGLVTSSITDGAAKTTTLTGGGSGGSIQSNAYVANQSDLIIAAIMVDPTPFVQPTGFTALTAVSTSQKNLQVNWKVGIGSQRAQYWEEDSSAVNWATIICGLKTITTTATQTQLGKSRISGLATKTQLGKALITTGGTRPQVGIARITKTGVQQALAGLSRITASILATIAGKAHITASTGYTKFMPTAVAHIGNRVYYVSQQFDTNGNAFSVVYVSDPGLFQNLTTDQNILQLPNQLKITIVAGVQGAVYLIGPHWVYVTQDTGEKPVQWSNPQLVDGRKGALVPNCVEVHATGKWMWIADKTGLYYFDGAFPSLPISHLQSDLWNLVEFPQEYMVIKDDPLRHRVIVNARMSDTQTVKHLVWDYTNGDPRDPYSVRFSIQDPGTGAGASIEMVQNDLVGAGQAVKDQELWVSAISPVAHVAYFSREKDPDHDTNVYRDSQFGTETAIHTVYETNILPSSGVGQAAGITGVIAHQAADLGITGNGDITPYIETYDRTIIKAMPTINLVSTPEGPSFTRCYLKSQSGIRYRFEQSTLDAHFTISSIIMYYTKYASHR